MIAMRGLARFHARWWGASQKAPLDFAHHPSRGGGPLPAVPKRLAHTISVMIIKTGLKALPHCYLELPQYAGRRRRTGARSCGPQHPTPPSHGCLVPAAWC